MAPSKQVTPKNNKIDLSAKLLAAIQSAYGTVNDDAAIEGVLQMLQDIEIDEVSGVYTKQAFMHHAKTLLEENPDGYFDLMISDLENFKLVNSIYGVSAGDQLLKYLGESFTNLPGCRLCGRYGGDQFVLLLNTEEKAPGDVFYRWVEEIRQKAPVAHQVIRFGLVRGVEREDTVAALCNKAMLALNSAKHTGKDIIALYDGQVLHQHYRARMYEASFERALENREFVIWFQPKYSTFTKQMTGAEALVRWNNPDREGIVFPGEFIPVFEENGMITRLDEYVFRTVCGIQRDLIARGYSNPVPISINLSRATLLSPGSVEHYQAMVEEFGISKDLVPLELTESATITTGSVRELTEQLKALGFRLHMDDFGSGYSSLSSLCTLQFDTLKLDKSLIDHCGDKRGDELLRHIVEIAHFFQMEVVAEGVETNDQYAFLKKLGCDTIQGYLFAKPMSLETCMDSLRQRAGNDQLSEEMVNAMEESASVGSLRITTDVKLQYLSAVASIYMTMHVINLREDTVVEFATTTNVRKAAHQVHNAPAQMAGAMRATVAPDSLDAVLEFTDLTTLPARMKGKRTIYTNFHGLHFDRVEARFIAVTTNEADEPEIIIFTTRVLETDRRQEEVLEQTSETGTCRTDVLTGAYNRYAFDEDMQLYADPANGEKVDSPELSLMLVDVDHLKAANEAHGHAAGDELLCAVAELLTNAFGKNGSVYRVGDDEFVALFYADSKRRDALAAFYRQVEADWMGNEIRSLSTSRAMVSRWELPGVPVTGLLKQAEERLAEEKAKNLAE